MSIEEILGFARVLMDSFGLTQVLTAMLYIGVAAFAFRAFVSRGRD